MADLADQANERNEAFQEAALGAARAPVPASPKPSGECHHCGEPVESPRLFCDADCARGWDRLMKRGMRA